MEEDKIKIEPADNEPEKTQKGVKENIYDQIPLTVKQLDIIILVLAIAIVIFFVIGVLKGNGLQ